MNRVGGRLEADAVTLSDSRSGQWRTPCECAWSKEEDSARRKANKQGGNERARDDSSASDWGKWIKRSKKQTELQTLFKRYIMRPLRDKK